MQIDGLLFEAQQTTCFDLPDDFRQFEHGSRHGRRFGKKLGARLSSGYLGNRYTLSGMGGSAAAFLPPCSNSDPSSSASAAILPFPFLFLTDARVLRPGCMARALVDATGLRPLVPNPPLAFDDASESELPSSSESPQES